MIKLRIIKEDKVNNNSEDKIIYYSENEMQFSLVNVMASNVSELDSSQFYLFKYADGLRLIGRFKLSERYFKSIDIRKIPKEFRPDFYLYFGMLYYDSRRDDLATKYFKKSIKYGIENTMPYNFLATIYMSKEKIDDAIEVLLMGASVKGDTDELYYNLSTCFAIKGNFTLAIEYINKCLELDNEYPNAINLKNDFEECLILQNT